MIKQRSESFLYRMTASFERLGTVEKVMLITLLSALPTFLFPARADAQAINKTRLIFEIKNFPAITIPDPAHVPTLSEIPIIYENKLTIASNDNSDIVEIGQPAPVVTEAAKPPLAKSNALPPKVAKEDRVYMHEPEIREYLCPKLGAKCDIFIAILKAENGTHECTRDNRGLNKNGSVDVGLAQINWNPKYNPPYTLEQLRDCKFNLDIAMQKYDARGFSPWYAYTKGAYKKHLTSLR